MKRTTSLYAAAFLTAGAFVTVMTAADIKTTAIPDTFEYSGYSPESGATVKQISSVTLRINSNYGEFMVCQDDSKLSDVKITDQAGNVVATATSFGEGGFDEETLEMLFPIEFDAVEAAGTYTVTIPKGLYVEGQYSSTAGATVPVEGGKISKAATIEYTVDPNVKGKLDNYTLTPAAGSNAGSLDNLRIVFPDLDIYSAPLSSEEGVAITISNGTETYAGSAIQDWNVSDVKTMRFIFEKDGEEVTFAPGKWTLTIPAGAFVCEGEKNGVIEAEYTVVSASEIPFSVSETFPAMDSDVKKLNTITLMYNNIGDESVNLDESLLENIQLLKDGKNTWTEYSFGEPMMDERGVLSIDLIPASEQTAAGEYELRLPKGMMYQTRYNSATGSFEVFEGYKVSNAQSIYFNVSPNAKGFLEDVTVEPSADTAVTQLDNVSLTFNSIPGTMQVNTPGTGVITLTNGDVKYEGEAIPAWNSNPVRFNIIFTDNSGNEVVPGPGTWTLDIPEGYFEFGNDKSEAMQFVYTISSMMISPEEGSTLSEIKEFIVSFPGAKNVEYVGSDYMFTLVAGQTWGIPSFNVARIDGAEVPSFRITPPEDHGSPTLGSLLFSIEEGAFLIDGEEGATEGNSPRFQATYYYDKEIEQTYVPEPNAESVVCQSWGYTVGFAFDESTSPSLANGGEGIVVKFNDTVLRMGSENACYSGKADYCYAIMDNILTFMVANSEYFKEGTVTVTLPGTAYRLSGKPGFDITHSWNVVMPKEYGYSLTPEGGATEAEATTVASLSEFTLSFPEAKSGEIFLESGISLRKSDYSLFMTAEIAPVADAACPTYTLRFTPEAGKEFTDGAYELSVRYDTFVLDGVQTWPANYTNIQLFYNLNKLSGVEGIEVDSDNVTVVTPSGTVLLNNVPAERLNELSKGIYIVNGKKKVVK